VVGLGPSYRKGVTEARWLSGSYSFDRIMKSHEIRLFALQIVIDTLDGNLSPRSAPKRVPIDHWWFFKEENIVYIVSLS